MEAFACLMAVWIAIEGRCKQVFVHKAGNRRQRNTKPREGHADVACLRTWVFVLAGGRWQHDSVRLLAAIKHFIGLHPGWSAAPCFFFSFSFLFFWRACKNSLNFMNIICPSVWFRFYVMENADNLWILHLCVFPFRSVWRSDNECKHLSP